MSRLVLTQITIKKERSISSTTWYYLLQPSNASAPDSTNYGNPPPTYSTTGYSGWSNIEPTYVVGDDRVLYVMVQTLYSDGTFSYSTPSISSSYEAAKDAYDEIVQAESVIEQFEELGLKKGYIWDNATYTPASGSIPVYPIGTYIASGILVNGNRSITHSNSNTYGLNTWISTGGINLRYNAIDLMKLTTSNLEFYYPSTSSQQKKAISLGTNGAINSLAFYGFNSDNKTMELTNDGLYFYNPSDGSTELASFTANGLVLKKGGITGGTFTNQGTNNRFVYLSTEDYGTTISINGHSASNWRQIIGTKFGVDNDGNLYASNAVISGAITATSLTLGSGVTVSTNNISGLSTVATSGSYNDLDNKPTIPSLTGYIHTDGTIGSTATEGANSFTVASSGALTASNAIIYGTLYASKGYIGGWQIGTDGNKSLHNGSSNTSPTIGNNTIILSKGLTSTTSIAGSSGSQTWTIAASTNFGVTTAGKLYATGAEISGDLTASSLKINGNNYLTDITTISSKASGNAEYEVVIKVNSIDYTNSSATLIAIPTKLGESTTGSFVWYKNTINTAHGGTISTTTNTNDTLTVSDLDALYIAVLQ